jgi:peptidyl-prolyl cis-trans isomerase C
VRGPHPPALTGLAAGPCPPEHTRPGRGGDLLLGLLLLTVACARAEPPAPDVVARVGDQQVRYSEFEEWVAQTAGDSDSVLASDVLSQLFDQFLDEKVLVRMARDRGLLRTAERGPRDAIDALLQKNLEEEPAEEEIALYYEQRRQEFVRPERVRLRQILTEDRASAEKALQQLAAGEAFIEVARRLSRDPSAQTGGYQGELSREDLPPAFADVIFSLKPGEVSRIVPAEYGFHIFLVIDRPPAGVVPLEDAREEIVERLRQERADRHLAELVREGRTQYNVEVHGRNLPFNYKGSYL